MGTPWGEMERYHREWFDQSVAQVAQELRDLADKVEREGKPTPTEQMGAKKVTPYSDRAQRIMHAVTWGLANSNLDRMRSHAAAADAARAAAGGAE